MLRKAKWCAARPSQQHKLLPPQMAGKQVVGKVPEAMRTTTVHDRNSTRH